MFKNICGTNEYINDIGSLKSFKVQINWRKTSFSLTLRKICKHWLNKALAFWGIKTEKSLSLE